MTDGGYSFPLTDNVQVALNASGNAILRIGPANAYQVWQITSVGVQCDTTNPNPVVSVYNSNNPSSQFMGGTYNGAQNSANISATLYAGQQICATFTGGNPGSIVTLSVQGTVTVP
jgi:hypothetical protein